MIAKLNNSNVKLNNSNFELNNGELKMADTTMHDDDDPKLEIKVPKGWTPDPSFFAGLRSEKEIISSALKAHVEEIMKGTAVIPPEAAKQVTRKKRRGGGEIIIAEAYLVKWVDDNRDKLLRAEARRWILEKQRQLARDKSASSATA